jgi:hypothetical protein
MPDLTTSIIHRLKLHIECNISQENILRYNIDINCDIEDDMKKQIIFYYQKQLKFFALKCNEELVKAITDINNFYSEYSYNIVRYVEEYITLFRGFKEFVNLSTFGIYFFRQKDIINENYKKTNTTFCDMVDNRINQIYRMLTTNMNSDQPPILTEEEYEECSNLPVFCRMVRERLLV